MVCRQTMNEDISQNRYVNASYDYEWPILEHFMGECCQIFSCSDRPWKLAWWGVFKHNSTKRARTTKISHKPASFRQILHLQYTCILTYIRNQCSTAWIFGTSLWECHTMGRHVYQPVVLTYHEWNVCNINSTRHIYYTWFTQCLMCPCTIELI